MILVKQYVGRTSENPGSLIRKFYVKDKEKIGFWKAMGVNSERCLAYQTVVKEV